MILLARVYSFYALTVSVLFWLAYPFAIVSLPLSLSFPPTLGLVLLSNLSELLSSMPRSTSKSSGVAVSLDVACWSMHEFIPLALGSRAEVGLVDRHELESE